MERLDYRVRDICLRRSIEFLDLSNLAGAHYELDQIDSQTWRWIITLPTDTIDNAISNTAM